MSTADERAAILAEALPHIQRLAGRIVVVKYGGNAMGHGVAGFAADVALLRAVGLRPVVVHGGGPQIGELMGRLGLEPRFVDGLRVTDSDTLDVARMVLVGKVNRELVAAINVHAPVAVGLSGEDASLIAATPRDPALGFVGDVDAVAPELLHRLLSEGLVPVIATIGVDAAGQAYNINADAVAGAVAVAVGADKLVFLTDVDGIRRDRSDPSTLVAEATAEEIDALVASGVVGDGMVPKVAACTSAVRGGVARAHVIDGRRPHALLLELLTDEGVGTMVVA